MAGIFSRKKDALAMFGSRAAIDALVEMNIFAEAGINLIHNDFVTIEELLDGLREYKNAKYVLISNEAFRGIEEGRYRAIEAIRKEYPDIEIAVFISHEEPDERFRSFAYGYKVYNIYYSDENGNFDFKQVIYDLQNNTMPSSEKAEKEKQKKLETKEEGLLKMEESLKEREAFVKKKTEELAMLEKQRNEGNEKENEKEIIKAKADLTRAEKNLEDERKAKENLALEYEREKEELKRKAEKEKEELRKKADEEIKKLREENMKKSAALHTKFVSDRCVQIGVFSTTKGAGSTFTTIDLAERFANLGFKVAALSYDGKLDFEFIEGKKKAHYFCPTKQDRKEMLIRLLSQDYEFLIVDFGTPFAILPNGRIDDRNANEDSDLISTLYQSFCKIGLGFSEPWHVDKLLHFNGIAAFETGEMSKTLFAIKDYENIQHEGKYNLSICERDLSLVFSILCDWLGCSDIAEKPKKKGFFSR